MDETVDVDRIVTTLRMLSHSVLGPSGLTDEERRHLAEAAVLLAESQGANRA